MFGKKIADLLQTCSHFGHDKASKILIVYYTGMQLCRQYQWQPQYYKKNNSTGLMKLSLLAQRLVLAYYCLLL